MSETYKLAATTRDVVGKKVGKFRREGQIPGVIYGPNFEPVNIFISEGELRRVLAQAGGTHLLELEVNGEIISALAREVQRNPIRNTLTHVDFYRVAMDRVIRTEVPVVLIGTSPAIVRKEAIAIHPTNVLHIECLPADLLSQIEVDISGLINIGDQIQVSQLELPSTIRILNAPDDLLVKLDYAEAIALPEEAVEGASVTAEVEVITARKPSEEEEA